MKKTDGNGKKFALMLLISAILVGTLLAGNAMAYDEYDDYDSTYGGHTSYVIDLPDGGALSYTIDEIDGGAVNVYLMTEENYQLYYNGMTYDTIEEDYDITWSVSNSLTLEPGYYRVVVESSSSGTDVSYHYNLKYGSDYSPSSWDSFFLSGLFSGLGCIISIVFFLIWVYMLIWVYKDANRRGKSGALWLIIVFFLNIIGLIIWLIVRPPIQQYPTQYAQAPPPQYPAQNYQQPPPQQYQVPPQQAVPTMPPRCPNCGAQVDPNWNSCPNCGAKLR